MYNVWGKEIEAEEAFLLGFWHESCPCGKSVSTFILVYYTYYLWLPIRFFFIYADRLVHKILGLAESRFHNSL